MKKAGHALSLKVIGPDSQSVHHWLEMANTLERSYNVLKREISAGEKKISQIVSSPELRSDMELSHQQQKSLMIALEKRNVIRPAIMLAAMALECHFKAIISMDTVPSKQGHKLVSLAKEAKFPLAGNDEDVLVELSRMIQLGRYHLTSLGD